MSTSSRALRQGTCETTRGTASPPIVLAFVAMWLSPERTV
jgi:hypothetical protein